MGRPNPADNAVALLIRHEIAEGKIGIPALGVVDQVGHVATGKRIIGIDIDRMGLKQRAEV
jgi:hypothetical protein